MKRIPTRDELKLPSREDLERIKLADRISQAIKELEGRIAKCGYAFAPIEYMGELIYAAEINKKARIVQGSEDDAEPVGSLPIDARIDAWTHIVKALRDDPEWGLS